MCLQRRTRRGTEEAGVTEMVNAAETGSVPATMTVTEVETVTARHGDTDHAPVTAATGPHVTMTGSAAAGVTGITVTATTGTAGTAGQPCHCLHQSWMHRRWVACTEGVCPV